MMERLTEKQSSGYDLKAMNGEWCNKYCEKQIAQTCNECGIYQAIQKLAEYEDLEEQGLLLRLPCKVGDKVYLICSRYSECSKYKERLDEYNCQRCEEDECDSHKEYYIHINYSVSIEWIVRNLNNFGKTVFLTKEEAEQKLKEMEYK